MRGAPFRVAAAVIGGWTIGRVVVLTAADLPAAVPVPMPVPFVVAPAFAIAPPAGTAEPSRIALRHIGPAGGQTIAVRHDRSAAPGGRSAAAAAPATSPAPSSAAAVPVASAAAPSAPPPQRDVPQPFAPATSRSRLSGDVWLIARPGGGDSLAFGQLGASQGGMRVTYALDDARRVTLSARVSAPLGGRGREAGVGLDLKPTSLPIHLLVEERIGLDGGGARPAATVVAGASLALPARVRLDGYAQGGAVWRRGGFVDAAALVARPLLDRGATRLEVGAGAWGAAQRRVARLDLGPSAALSFPAGGVAARLQLDYRVRVAGQARPRSGPALTLGGSF